MSTRTLYTRIPYYPPGLPDEIVLSIAHREQRVLITNDKDFGELVVRVLHPHSGVILLRFPLDSTAQQKINSLQEFLTSYSGSFEQFFVMTPQGTRTR